MRLALSNSMRRRRGLGATPATLPNGALIVNPATGSSIAYTVNDPTGLTAHYQDGSVLTVTPPATTTPAVTPSGTPVSTQTGAAITLVAQNEVVPGVWNCVMSDGTTHYCDNNQNPISYTPPPAPVATPATSSQPTSVVAPAVTPTPATVPATTPAAVTPSGTPISTTTGTPTSGTVISSVQGELSSLMTWLEGSLIGGIPNWLLVGGAVAGLMMFGDDGGSRRRR
jgi:hypothetical protein